MSADRVPPSTDHPAPGERLDFDEIAGSDQTSWARADPEAALIESTGRYGYRVTLPDGDAHLVAVAREHGEHVGTCDCEGWEYNDGPCAHLCTVRKAAFAGVEDVEGDSVMIPRVDLDAHSTDERAVADGGFVDQAQRTDATGGRR
ncbi:hypothetical protein [Halolamina salina]|uniref:SWIM-type domain-containing protein n=1 Tax=Halolamina salina TaxID=1220023 RepID=A0ABD6B9A5_9EURY